MSFEPGTSITIGKTEIEFLSADEVELLELYRKRFVEARTPDADSFERAEVLAERNLTAGQDRFQAGLVTALDLRARLRRRCEAAAARAGGLVPC